MSSEQTVRTLVVAEQGNGELDAATARIVSAAVELGGEVDVLVVGSGAGRAAETAARLDGVQRVHCCEAAHYDHGLAENTAALIAGMTESYTHLLAAASTTGRNIMPRVAALSDVAQLSEVVAIQSPDTFVRPIYAGSVLATVQSDDALRVLTIRPTAFDAVGEQEAAPIELLPAGVDTGLASFVDEQLVSGERPELSSARVVISGGRGLGSGDNFRLIEAVADRLGAAIGASRAAVDAGYVPNDMQVGQTGKMVAPELYIAVGISGSIQHLAGMKDSRVIVAINHDDEAPIFQVADYGLVADLFETLPELADKLPQRLT
ncbi:electron transfer flavoprotein subunit alpha/FixB family protein [Kushneria phosphatilytica]|uniref:Electron transfer flavoprotein subunit alpha n=1 Tax=Kushneria phosphatilytica TaxID=657387 RepID=A0A1S1NWR5_9GAMM|nr:FAD-binding protein [Kushneria phosphatilytica]OHV11816.1 electron transfer flavoprotein subunit alpha [Kushneria phosphatilytica]QEL10981.1 electron transfer flavoprotein subunit alpha/FixB family protein [Kushneria phosphatilytica]